MAQQGIAYETFSSATQSEPLMDSRVAACLIADKSTGENLRWATDSYEALGTGYLPSDQLTLENVMGMGTAAVVARAKKSTCEQQKRTRAQAEVFTPSWVCNEQNNLVDAAWFGHPSPFNKSRIGSWETIHDSIPFSRSRPWSAYVDNRVLEVSCGEAPYLVSRYDAVTGKSIPLEDRIGLLDRKLRVVRENAKDSAEWDRWTLGAFESAYGFDLQGDNVLLARENLLASYDEHSELRPGGAPASGTRQKVVNVICWNVFQMDGLTFNAPYAERPAAQQSIFTLAGEDPSLEPVPCRIYDWRAKRPVEYRALLRR